MRNVRGASSGDFNPLPRKEGDRGWDVIDYRHTEFQSTPS